MELCVGIGEGERGCFRFSLLFCLGLADFLSVDFDEVEETDDVVLCWEQLTDSGIVWDGSRGENGL